MCGVLGVGGFPVWPSVVQPVRGGAPASSEVADCLCRSGQTEPLRLDRRQACKSSPTKSRTYKSPRLCSGRVLPSPIHLPVPLRHCASLTYRMHAFKALLALALALALAVAQAEVDDKLSVSGGGNRAMLSGLVFIDELQQTSGMVVGGLGCRPRALCCDGEIPFEKTTGLSGGSWAVAVNEAIGAKEALKRFRDYVTARSEHTLGEAVSGVQLGIKGDPRLSNSLVSGALLQPSGGHIGAGNTL